MKRLFVLALIIPLALTISACGRKTPPLPAKAVIAEAITDLRCQLDDQGVTLTWSYPRRSVTGAKIDTIRSFTVSKARIPADDYCSGCPVVYDYDFEVAAEGQEPGSSLSFRDTNLEAGYYYVYKVQARSGWRILSKDSNPVAFQRRDALQAPADLQVAIGDSTLTLSWSPVRTRTDGSEVIDLQYQVYRSLDNKNFSPLGLPVAGLSFIDPDVTNGRTYFYQVRALLTTDGAITLGSPGKTAIGMPVDMTPPPAPAELIAVVRRQGVQLHWQASTADDIDGYYIYRRGAEGTWQRIATTRAGAITYTDQSDLPSGVYSYRITAFDKGGRRNESAPSQTVTYTKP